MAYQHKQPCLPPPVAVARCSEEAKDPCTLANVAPCGPTCHCASLGPLPPSGAPPCPTAAPNPCAPLYIALHVCAEAPAAPSGSLTSQPCVLLPADAQPCPLETAEARPPPSLPTCGPSSSEASCSDPQGDMGLPYVVPGSTVCLEPCGSVSVKPGAPKEEENSIFLASYTPHFT